MLSKFELNGIVAAKVDVDYNNAIINIRFYDTDNEEATISIRPSYGAGKDNQHVTDILEHLIIDASKSINFGKGK